MNEGNSGRLVKRPNLRQSDVIKKGVQRNGELQIAVVVFPGFSSLDVALIDQIFHYGNQLSRAGERRYRVRLLSASGGLVVGTSNMQVWSDPAASASTDVVFVPGGEGTPTASGDAQLLHWLRDLHRRARLLIGVGEGRALIAEAGIAQADASARQRRAHADPATWSCDIYDPNGALLRALSVITDDLGIHAAQEVGERVVPDSSRWLPSILGEPSDDIRRDKIREAANWIEQNCSKPITVADISQFALMSERTLLRHFKAVIGMTPSDYLLKARFELACRLLVSTTLPIDKVARRCSFSSGMALAKLFRKRLSVSASEYRAAAQGHQN